MTSLTLSPGTPTKERARTWRTNSVLVGCAAIAAIISVLAATGCRTAAAPGAPARTRSTAGAERVPMRLVRGVPLVQVEVCGRGPYWFVVDTGCGIPLVISKRLAEEMQLPEVGMRGTVRGATGAKTAVRGLVNVDSVRFGKVEVKGQALALDLTDPKEALGTDFEGLLGIQAFTGVLLTIDLPRRELVFEKGNLPPADGAEILAYRVEEGVPVIDVSLGTKTVPLIVDSGADGDFIIPEAAGSDLRFKSKPVSAALLAGVGGVSRERIGRLNDEVRIGRHVIKDPLVSLLPAPAATGHIGIDLLKHFSVTFDQEHKTVRLRRKETSPITTPAFRTTGMGLRKRPDKWKVEDIIPNTPAERLDIKVGDEVLAVNKRAVSEIDPDAWHDLVEKKKALMLDMEREGKRSQVNVPVVTLVP